MFDVFDVRNIQRGAHVPAPPPSTLAITSTPVCTPWPTAQTWMVEAGSGVTSEAQG